MPSVIGVCQSDIPSIANTVNSAQERLLLSKEAGDEGWWGTWAEMAFTVSATSPYLTTPRSVARIQSLTLCDEVMGLQNQFYEYLDFGNGRMPKQYRTCDAPEISTAYTRNNVPTFVDLSDPPQILRVYFSDPADVGRRVLLQGTDNNDEVIYTLDTYNPTNGQFVTLASPFVDSPMQFNSITGIQKDITLGNVEIKQVDPTSGAEVTLLTMEPGEQTASYRRYYFDALPGSCCCNRGTSDLTLTAIVKLELIPVNVDTDYCLIPNREAIIEECASLRLSECDDPRAKQMSRERHQMAISMLNGQLNHYLGTQKPAVSFKPFGSAELSKKAIGRLI